MVAPTTAAPEGSVRAPWIVPVEIAWPREVAGRRRSTRQLRTPIQIDLTTRLERGMPTTSESNFQKMYPETRGNREHLRRCIEPCGDNVNKEVDKIFTCA